MKSKHGYYIINGFAWAFVGLAAYGAYTGFFS